MTLEKAQEIKFAIRDYDIDGYSLDMNHFKGSDEMNGYWLALSPKYDDAIYSLDLFVMIAVNRGALCYVRITDNKPVLCIH